MPRLSDAGTSDCLVSYPPPTTGAATPAPCDNEAAVFDNDLTDAAGFNAPHGGSTSGQRGSAD